MICPIVEYAASLLFPTPIARLESIQRIAARFCFDGLSRYSSVSNMLSSQFTGKKNSS